MPDDGLIDPALVREQFDGLPPALIDRIIAAFEDDLAALRPRLLDPARHAGARHTLKGLAGNFGAARLMAVAGMIPPDADMLDRAMAEAVQAVRAAC